MTFIPASASTKPPADETPEERRERRMKAKLLAKKKRQKALFNSGGLDSTKEEKTYYEMQREEMQKQAEVRGQLTLVLLSYIKTLVSSEDLYHVLEKIWPQGAGRYQLDGKGSHGPVKVEMDLCLLIFGLCMPTWK